MGPPAVTPDWLNDKSGTKISSPETLFPIMLSFLKKLYKEALYWLVPLLVTILIPAPVKPPSLTSNGAIDT